MNHDRITQAVADLTKVYYAMIEEVDK